VEKIHPLIIGGQPATGSKSIDAEIGACEIGCRCDHPGGRISYRQPSPGIDEVCRTEIPAPITWLPNLLQPSVGVLDAG